MFSFIFIGRSGCGKGTQADLLQAYIKSKDESPILYIETGANFREFIKGANYTNTLSKQVYESDHVQPAFLAAYMWSFEMVAKYTGKEHLIFDGTPRSLEEAQILAGALDFYSIASTVVIHLEVSRAWSERHLLSRGRSDDANISRIDKRLDWFDANVIPAINYFKSNSKYHFVEVNGEQTIAEVQNEIIEKLKPVL
jgi:adenylate kinase